MFFWQSVTLKNNWDYCSAALKESFEKVTGLILRKDSCFAVSVFEKPFRNKTFNNTQNNSHFDLEPILRSLDKKNNHGDNGWTFLNCLICKTGFARVCITKYSNSFNNTRRKGKWRRTITHYGEQGLFGLMVWFVWMRGKFFLYQQ